MSSHDENGPPAGGGAHTPAGAHHTITNGTPTKECCPNSTGNRGHKRESSQGYRCPGCARMCGVSPRFPNCGVSS